ncbi:copper-binding protein [Cupriavidus sp. 30B13]|uniref:copper-binding protein n=1 Tax=Cupriavidus sp. 30B13 TaxID=3384241 RepID=UPI003B91F734
MKHFKILPLVLAFSTAPAVFAAAPMDGMAMKPSAPAAASAGPAQPPHPVPAEIRKIDLQSGKVTLKHGPIENLGMPAMTMAFPAKDRASLKDFKEGDSVSATFDKIDGRPTVVDMQRK